jgi:hypothetical protein
MALDDDDVDSLHPDIKYRPKLLAARAKRMHNIDGDSTGDAATTIEDLDDDDDDEFDRLPPSTPLSSRRLFTTTCTPASTSTSAMVVASGNMATETPSTRKHYFNHRGTPLTSQRTRKQPARTPKSTIIKHEQPTHDLLDPEPEREVLGHDIASSQSSSSIDELVDDQALDFELDDDPAFMISGARLFYGGYQQQQQQHKDKDKQLPHYDDGNDDDDDDDHCSTSNQRDQYIDEEIQSISSDSSLCSPTNVVASESQQLFASSPSSQNYVTYQRQRSQHTQTTQARSQYQHARVLLNDEFDGDELDIEEDIELSQPPPPPIKHEQQHMDLDDDTTHEPLPSSSPPPASSSSSSSIHMLHATKLHSALTQHSRDKERERRMRNALARTQQHEHDMDQEDDLVDDSQDSMQPLSMQGANASSTPTIAGITKVVVATQQHTSPRMMAMLVDEIETGDSTIDAPQSSSTSLSLPVAAATTTPNTTTTTGIQQHYQLPLPTAHDATAMAVEEPITTPPPMTPNATSTTNAAMAASIFRTPEMATVHKQPVNSTERWFDGLRAKASDTQGRYQDRGSRRIVKRYVYQHKCKTGAVLFLTTDSFRCVGVNRGVLTNRLNRLLRTQLAYEMAQFKQMANVNNGIASVFGESPSRPTTIPGDAMTVQIVSGELRFSVYHAYCIVLQCSKYRVCINVMHAGA